MSPYHVKKSYSFIQVLNLISGSNKICYLPVYWYLTILTNGNFPCLRSAFWIVQLNVCFIYWVWMLQWKKILFKNINCFHYFKYYLLNKLLIFMLKWFAGLFLGVLTHCNGTRTHNHLIHKRTLNHLAKSRLLRARSSLTFRQL